MSGSLDDLDTLQAGLALAAEESQLDDFDALLDLVHQKWMQLGEAADNPQIVTLLCELAAALDSCLAERALLAQAEALISASRVVQALCLSDDVHMVAKPWAESSFAAQTTAIVLAEDRLRRIASLSTLDYDIDEKRLRKARTDCQWTALMLTVMRANPGDMGSLDDSLWNQLAPNGGAYSSERIQRINELRRALHADVPQAALPKTHALLAIEKARAPKA
jgi:hypothetical protein